LLLIDRARYQGATWAQIADVLGLASRQAAQQRRERLVGSAQARRRALDERYSAQIAALRVGVAELDRWIGVDRHWVSRFPRAGLVRDTVTAAADASPGSLYALAVHVVADLVDAGLDQLPRPVRSVTATMQAALSTKD
jgi:hypothetical protein